jgi:hypothetical protein
MPTFSGKYEYRSGNGGLQQSGACSLAFDHETMRLAAGTSPGLAIDLGDIDVIEAADYQLSLKIYDGTTILLNQFGKSFENMRHDLLESWRTRVVQCLLLEDLEEVTRIDGFAQLESNERSFSSAAEIRLYKSNIAILPVNATVFQWRLADIDTVDFDETTYTLLLRCGKDRLSLTRLAKRTREFQSRLLEIVKVLSDKSAQVIHALFPFLSPGQFIEAAALMKEGRSVAVSNLASLHRSIEQALVQNAVGVAFRPYFNFLKQRAAAPGPYFGFKLIRKEEEEDKEEIETASTEATAESDSGTDAAAEKESAEPLLELGDESLFCWFMFPLAGGAAPANSANVVAWECTSQVGRATYVFRLPKPGQLMETDEAVRRINRGIVMVNFRREPIYLPDSSLEIQPRFRRYAIAQRNLSELRDVRSLFMGRAIHTSVDAWQEQLQSLLKKSG